MAIAQTYTETQIEYGVVNIIGAAVDKLDSNIGLLVLIGVFTSIVAAVSTFITVLLALGKNMK